MSTTETKLAQNRVYARDLGWAPAELGATDFNTLLVTLIAAQQQIIGVNVDAVCGPTTYRMILAHRQAELVMNKGAAPTDADFLRICGQIAMLEAKRAWLTDILDLPAKTAPDYERCRSFVDDTIRSTLGIHWYWEGPYPMTGGFKWCGAAAARWQAAAGLSVAARQKFFSSTYRLDRWARYLPIDPDPAFQNKRPAIGPYRQILELDEHSKPTDAFFGPGDPPRAGDIVMVGPPGGPLAYGQHVCTVESFDVGAGVFVTLEGNGSGLDPHGTPQHGVVRARRPVGSGGSSTVYHVRRVIRLAPGDFR